MINGNVGNNTCHVRLFAFDSGRIVTHFRGELMAAPAFIPQDYFGKLTPADIFGVDGPFEVDLGCGDGGFLLQMAEHYPERRFLGIERLLGRVRGVCSKAIQRNLENVKVCRIESRYFLEWLMEPGCISRLHYLCPDPWPKERHHKNRLVQDDFVPVLHRAFAPGGEFLFKSDHEEYYEWVLDHVERSGLFTRADWGEDDFFYPKTDFQLQWEGMGKQIYRARFIKR